MFKKIALIAAVTLSLAACKTIPVRDYDHQITSSANKQLTKKDVEKAIVSACQQRGWMCKATSEGTIAGLLDVRKHQVKIDIVYDEKSYSLKYKDSMNMKYDGDSIHKKYGQWMNNLSRSIDNQLFY